MWLSLPPHRKTSNQLQILRHKVGQRFCRPACPYPWQSGRRVQSGDHWVAFAVGKGRVHWRLSEPVPDPETFAQDLRRLIDKAKSIDKSWMLDHGRCSVSQPHHGVTTLELIIMPKSRSVVQVRVKGSFHSIPLRNS